MSGNDIALGGCGANTMQGLGSVAAGAPRGPAGFDILVGGLSADVIEGNNSTAPMIGGRGNDEIHGDGTIIGGANDGTVSSADGVFCNLRIGDHLKGDGAANSFVYRKDDVVQWIENCHPAEGDSLQVYGYAAPTAVGTANGFIAMYFGPNDALVFNGPAPTESISSFGYQDSAPGAYGHRAPLPPTLLTTAVTTFSGTQGDGDNLLIGGVGNDTFHGGADLHCGGSGNDLHQPGGPAETIVEQANGGQDMVVAGFNLTLAATVENLILARGTGNTLDNTPVGNEGDNILGGLAGNDTYVVDSLADVVNEAAGGGIDTVVAIVNAPAYALGANLENLVPAGTVRFGTANVLDNGITGNGPAKWLMGQEGSDTLEDWAATTCSPAARAPIP